MATEVIMPALEMAQETGRLLRWLKAEGETVGKGEPLMEIETDKVTVEIEAPADGTLGGVRASEGDEVPVGQTVAFILAPGEEPPAEAAPAAAAPAADGSARAVATVEAPPQQERRRALASPKARRIAAERGIDLDLVAGTGPHGAVVATDLDLGAGATPAAAPSVDLGFVWRRMAERMEQSWRSTPHFFLLREVDAGRLKGWRRSLRGREGYGAVSHTDLLVKLCAAALVEHPRVNAAWHDGSIVPNEKVNVGIAVAVDDGLVVPVVHGADELGLAEIAARRGELVAAAREGRLRPEHVGGGTFTISNLGMYGVDAFLAILNPPQAAILAVGRIADRVVAVDGRPEVRPTLMLALSFDHRVVDGARGAAFLDTLANLVEEPAGLVA